MSLTRGTVRIAMALLVAAARVSPAQTGTPESQMLGQWASARLEGIGTVQRPECGSIQVTERRLRLNLVPGTQHIEGEWVRWTRTMWTNTDSLKCRWSPEDTAFLPLLQASWAYLLDGEYDSGSGVMEIDGRYVRCDGNACDRWKVDDAGRRFTTKLRLRGPSTLVDTAATPDDADDVEFLRLTRVSDLMEDAGDALAIHLGTLDRRGYEAFYKEDTAEDYQKNTPLASSRAQFDELFSRVGATVERKRLNEVYTNYAAPLGSGSVACALFINQVRSSKDIRGMEFVALCKEHDAWKVRWIAYGS